MNYPYVLVLNNPEKNHILAFGFDTWEACMQKHALALSQGWLDVDTSILLDVDPKEVVKELAK